MALLIEQTVTIYERIRGESYCRRFFVAAIERGDGPVITAVKYENSRGREVRRGKLRDRIVAAFNSPA